ncbi:alkaline exonuclease [Phascolarctid gammaherpesvirus 1]|uniref:Alkaline exonuclease n=1 Tax=Phascolarctid gammaherpesvirus 1 TaxID=2249313 RepID=A0A3S8D7R4_9GAMA|nr:alkaline exonuclease [Phascolarctid gammaherpesvirus 1]AZB49212.1 alkaline exonuclease [Phascolarctid gammaherpesvirus 1]
MKPLRLLHRLILSRNTLSDVDIPFIPRLVMEVRKNQGTCVLSAVTDYLVDGVLDVAGLAKHVRDALTSSRFLGFVMVILLECEDRGCALDIFPHILSERCLLYLKNDTVAMEMCALISMVENLLEPTSRTLWSVLTRAEELLTLQSCPDLSLLYHGLKKLIFTSVEYLELDWPYSESGTGMHVYKLYKELSRFQKTAAFELLLSAMIKSKKLDFITGDIMVESCMDAKLVYVETMFTRSLTLQSVRNVLLQACAREVTLDSILHK